MVYRTYAHISLLLKRLKLVNYLGFFFFLSEVYGLSDNNLLRYKLNIFSHLESVDQLSFNRFNSLYST